ncbi:MAG: aspartate/glutamate racemase family protein, partial [Cyanobacteria bacterium J06648_11]
PGARAAVRQGQRIGIWATPATAKSHAYRAAIQEMNPDIPCWEIGCTKFVPLIESGKLRGAEARATILDYLNPLLAEGIDTLVYGCTHYPLLAAELLEVLPEGIQPVNPAVSLVSAVRKELECLGLLARGRKGATQFFVTGNDADRFAHLAARLLTPTTGAFRGVHPLIRVRSVCLDAVPVADGAALEERSLDAALMPFPLHAE